MIDYFALCVATGLVVELIGAFFLAVEAIGLDRIRNWREKTRIPVEVLRTHKTAEMQRRANNAEVSWMPGVLIGIGSGVGGGVGALLAEVLNDVLAGRAKGFSLPLGLALGAFAGAFALDGVSFLLRRCVSMLIWIELRAEKGVIGVIGFTVLATGILLQLAGTLSLVWKK